MKLTDQFRTLEIGESFTCERIKKDTVTQTRQRIQKETGKRFSVRNEGDYSLRVTRVE